MPIFGLLMKQIVSIVLLICILVASIGLVQSGANCCTLRKSAIMQPVFANSCCCEVPGGQNMELNCCSQIVDYNNLHIDAESLDAKLEWKKEISQSVGIVYFGMCLAPKFLSNYQYTPLATTISEKPPGRQLVDIYKIFGQLLVYS